MGGRVRDEVREICTGMLYRCRHGEKSGAWFMTQDNQSGDQSKNSGFKNDYSTLDEAMMDKPKNEAIMDKPKEKRGFKIPALLDVPEIKMVKLAVIVFVIFTACIAAYQAITVFWSEDSCIINGVKNTSNSGAMAVVKSCRAIHKYR